MNGSRLAGFALGRDDERRGRTVNGLAALAWIRGGVLYAYLTARAPMSRRQKPSGQSIMSTAA